MMEVYVVYYDEMYRGFGERGAEQRRIEGVYDSAEKAREMVNKLNKMVHIAYADFDPYEVE
jgi:hypothetical protein